MKISKNKLLQIKKKVQKEEQVHLKYIWSQNLPFLYVIKKEDTTIIPVKHNEQRFLKGL